MHLKSLTLKGFKSFAHATTFEFEPGVTAIVGPNGSGKSNVLDALAWVMGEQGAKSLRGGKMEDVIFAGTSQRGPLGRAEVKLTIDNSDGALPIEYSEVTISRILFRNGSSEYAINGEACRLLDVQELLSDSGLGREMHVIVGQGQLDAVLRATPEDRRGFIEEAAGILKHRRRRERTARKLDAMETNLSRLQDLAGELRRQLKPLGRQAEVAKQAQTIAAEVRDARARLIADDIITLRAELDDLARDESERHSERLVLQEQLEHKQLRIQQLEAAQAGDDVDQARRITLDLESERSRLRGIAAEATQRLAFLAAQAESPDGITVLDAATVTAAHDEVAALETQLPQLRSEWESRQAALRELRTTLEDIDSHIAEQSALISQHDLTLSRLGGTVAAAEQKHATVAQEQQRREDAVAQAAARVSSAEAELDHFLEQQPERPSADGLETAYQSALDAQHAAEDHRDAQRDAVHDRERQASALEATTEALRALLADRDASGDVAGLPGMRGTVSDHITVTPGYEARVALALGHTAEALLVDGYDHARAAIAHAREEDLGQVKLVLAEHTGAAGDGAGSAYAANETETLAGLATPLVPAYEVVDGFGSIRGLLADVYFAEADVDPHALAESVSLLTQARPGARVVTGDGTVWTRHTLSGGSPAAPSRIELNAEREAALAALDEVNRELHTLRDAWEAARVAAAEAQQATADAYAKLRENDAELAQFAEQRKMLTVRVETSIAEHERAQAALQHTAGTLTDAGRALEEARAALAAAQDRPRPILDVSERDRVAGELEAARHAEVEARLAHDRHGERLRAVRGRARELEARRERETQAAREAQQREARRRQQMIHTETIAEALPAVIDACEASLAEARVRQQQAEAERARHAQELTLLRSEASEVRGQLQGLTEKVHHAELRSYEKKLALHQLVERAGDELGLVESVLIAEYGPKAGAAEGESEPFDRGREEQRLARAERQLKELGRINPLALEEYAALEQRHRFLNEQLADLTKTRRDLMTIITELDDKMRDIFADAFADTRAAFHEVFPILFPGGSGDITLTNPDDMLTTGIEVTAKPAGKRVERLSLLSGGERSLAAVAWLIAIFQARPSPFYIMDEVEAALDDANLGRLLQVFRNLRQHSQLIIITHQKRTMEIADALYGVSMRGDGISTVVGQRI